MTSAGSVSINLFANISSFEKGINKATGLLGSIGSSLLSVQSIAGGFLAWKGVEFLKGTLNTIDSQAKLADRLGTSTEALVGLTHAGDLAGVSADQLATAMEKMSRNVADAGMGGKSAMDTLEKLGLKFSDLAQLKPEEQLGIVADHLNQLSSAGEKSKIAVELFGKAGAGMINVLQDGSAGLQAMQKDAEFLGLTFSRLDAAKVEQANDAITRLGSALKGGLISAAVQVSPIIEAIASGLVDSASKAGGFGSIMLDVLQAIGEKVGFLMDVWNALKMGFYATKTVFHVVQMGFIAVVDVVWKGIQYIAGLWRNWVQLVQDSSALIGSVFGFMWTKIKEGVSKFVQFFGGKLSDIIMLAAESISRVDIEMATSLRESAFAVGRSVGDLGAKAEKASSDASAKMKQSADDVKTSWNNLFNVKVEDSEFLKGLYDSAKKSGEDSAIAFVDSYEAVLNSEGTASVEAWNEKIRALSEAKAKLTAEAAVVRNSGTPFGPDPLEENKGPSVAEQLAEEYNIKLDHSKRLMTIEDEQQANAEKNAALWAQGWQGKGQVINQVLGNMSTLMNSQSKKAFQIGKAAAIAQTTISTAQAVMGAYSSMSVIPIVGPALGIAAAAAAAAAGLVQIQNIKSTTFGGGGSVSSSSGSISLVNGEPAGVGQSAAGVTGNQRNVIQLNFTGLSDNALLNGRQVRELITQINEAQQDGSPVITVNAAAA
jgi:hypothetical protein